MRRPRVIIRSVAHPVGRRSVHVHTVIKVGNKTKTISKTYH